MKKPEFVYIVKYHSGDLNKTFIVDVFKSRKVADAFIVNNYPNGVYNEDEDVLELSGKDDYIYIVKLEINQGEV